MKTSAAFLLIPILPLSHAFAPPSCQRSGTAFHIYHRNGQLQQQQHRQRRSFSLRAINKKRRKELGLPDDADEYDLDVALNNNTDAGITKIIAGSFILVMIALLVVGLV
ncbi:hypothetical protein ACHAXA_001568 [Cyclostephanos tholiformis]|uniref:Uncharacterized protein n=1 Tax=Cyclostephanos tholiformis TaxID=382380 RepID=A0ABD3RRN1_9STRA